MDFFFFLHIPEFFYSFAVNLTITPILILFKDPIIKYLSILKSYQVNLNWLKILSLS